MCLYKIHREAETMALISSSRPKTAPTTTNKLSSETDMRWDSAYFTKYIKFFPFDTLRILLKSTIYRVVMCSI